LPEELILDESYFTQLSMIEAQYDSLRIINPSDKQVDVRALTKHVSQVKGVNRIEELIIDSSSSLQDLSIVSAFPNLKYLFIHGHHIQSLDGIEAFRKGSYIKIQTHRNRRRDLSQLSKAKVKNIDLFVERKEDLTAIAGFEDINTLDIYHAMEPNLEEWENVRFQSLSFKSCKFIEFGDTAAISGLDQISVLGCRNLERFRGDNSNIKRLVVEGSKKLDVSTLKTFSGIHTLIVNSCTQEMNLTDLGGLEHIKHIDFILCQVQVDLIRLKEYFPNIESLHISQMKKVYGMQLKELNPDVKITSRSLRLE